MARLRAARDKERGFADVPVDLQFVSDEGGDIPTRRIEASRPQLQRSDVSLYRMICEGGSPEDWIAEAKAREGKQNLR
jgi:hypothetical protein